MALLQAKKLQGMFGQLIMSVVLKKFYRHHTLVADELTYVVIDTCQDQYKILCEADLARGNFLFKLRLAIEVVCKSSLNLGQASCLVQRNNTSLVLFLLRE